MWLNDYEKYIFNEIETKTNVEVWYRISKDRTDLEDFIEAIKKRIDMYDDCEFNGDYTKFKRIRTWEQHIKYWEENKLTNKK